MSPDETARYEELIAANKHLRQDLAAALARDGRRPVAKPAPSTDPEYPLPGRHLRHYHNFMGDAQKYCTRSEMAIWHTLFLNSVGGAAEMSIAELARWIGCSKMAVVSAIHGKTGDPAGGLIAKGLVVIVSTGEFGVRPTPNRYRVYGLLSPDWIHKHTKPETAHRR
jgi:hypothetical protein